MSKFKKQISIDLSKIEKTTAAEIKALPLAVDITKDNGGTVRHYLEYKTTALVLLAGFDAVAIEDGDDGDGQQTLSPAFKSAVKSITVSVKGLERISKGGTDKSNDRFNALFDTLLSTAPLKKAFADRWRAIGNEVSADQTAQSKKLGGVYIAPQGHGMGWLRPVSVDRS